MTITMTMLKPDSSTATTTPPTVIVCGNCGVEERRLLHHVRHRTMFCRLCTSCVLRLNSQSFCPVCFLVFDRTPPTEPVVSCFKCYSSSHLNCVPSPPPKKNDYTCPSCINPNAPIFTLKRVALADGRGGGGDGRCASARAIDERGARVLLAAATIAAQSMTKAAAAARNEAERRAKEAAFTKKRARESLERLVHLMADKDRRKVPIHSTTTTTTNKNNIKVATLVNSSVSLVATVPPPLLLPPPPPPPLPLPPPQQHHVDPTLPAAVDNHVYKTENTPSNEVEVLEAFNAVELKEKERLQQGAGVLASNGVAMDVEENVIRLGVDEALNKSEGAQGKEDISNGLQSMESGHAVGEKSNGEQQ